MRVGTWKGLNKCQWSLPGEDVLQIWRVFRHRVHQHGVRAVRHEPRVAAQLIFFEMLLLLLLLRVEQVLLAEIVLIRLVRLIQEWIVVGVALIQHLVLHLLLLL